MRPCTRRSRRGKQLKTPNSFYRCCRDGMTVRAPDCTRQIGVKKIDARVWAKVWEFFSQREKFEEALEAKIKVLEAREQDAAAECAKLEKCLNALELERQRVITMARKNLISESDLEMQLNALTVEQGGIQHIWNDQKLLVGNQAERLRELGRLYRQDVKAGADGINAVPETPEQEKAQFEARRRLIERLVEKIEVCKDKSLVIHTKLDFDLMVQNKAFSAS